MSSENTQTSDLPSPIMNFECDNCHEKQAVRRVSRVLTHYGKQIETIYADVCDDCDEVAALWDVVFRTLNKRNGLIKRQPD